MSMSEGRWLKLTVPDGVSTGDFLARFLRSGARTTVEMSDGERWQIVIGSIRTKERTLSFLALPLSVDLSGVERVVWGEGAPEHE